LCGLVDGFQLHRNVDVRVARPVDQRDVKNWTFVFRQLREHIWFAGADPSATIFHSPTSLVNRAAITRIFSPSKFHNFAPSCSADTKSVGAASSVNTTEEIISLLFLISIAIPFDMFGAEFTHEGEDCTFETMLKRFGLTDIKALRELAEIVHL